MQAFASLIFYNLMIEPSISSSPKYCTNIIQNLTSKYWRCVSNYQCHINQEPISMAQCQTAVSPLVMHWRYCSLALSCQSEPGIMKNTQWNLQKSIIVWRKLILLLGNNYHHFQQWWSTNSVAISGVTLNKPDHMMTRCHGNPFLSPVNASHKRARNAELWFLCC